jgi:omega-amidase
MEINKLLLWRLFMKIGLFQYDISWENKDANKSKILSILASSDTKNIDWIMFPEMTLSGFSMDLSKSTISDDDMAFFKKISKDHNCNVSFGGVVNSNNRVITINKKGDVVDQHSKVHLFGYGDETKHYKAGSDDTSFGIEGFRVKPLICYDLRFSYLFWDSAATTDLFFVIASWPSSRRLHWSTLLKARAIENQCYVIGVNRIGCDPKLTYSGDSVILDPLGNEVLNCGQKEELQTVEINVGEVLKTRESFPFLKDRLR